MERGLKVRIWKIWEKRKHFCMWSWVQGHCSFPSFPVVDWFCLFVDLWVLPFPLEDCSVFGNFVIALIFRSVFNGVCMDQSLFSCVVFCGTLFSPLSFCPCIVCHFDWIDGIWLVLLVSNTKCFYICNKDSQVIVCVENSDILSLI